MFRLLKSWQSFPFYLGIASYPFYRVFGTAAIALSASLFYLFPIPSHPQPSGPFQISSVDDELATNRPLFWNNEAERRKIYYKVYYPSEHVSDFAEKEPIVQYFENRMKFLCQLVKIPFFMLEYFKFGISNTFVNQPVLKNKQYPVVLVSHGLTGTFDSHLSLVQSIASHGYVVVVLDHIGCATVAYLPKSDLIYKYSAGLKNISLKDAFKKRQQHVQIRTQDLKDIINKLKLRNTDINDVLYGSLNLNSVHLLGHSLGGATALELSLPCIKSAIVMDAWTFPLSTNTIVQPALRHTLAIQASQWFYKGDDFGKNNDDDIYHYCRNIMYPTNVEKDDERDGMDRSIFEKLNNSKSNSESGYKAYLVRIPMGHTDPTDVKFMMNTKVLGPLGLYKALVTPLELHQYFDRSIVTFLNAVVNESFVGVESDLTKLQGSELELFQ